MIDIKELRRLAQAAIAKMNASDPEFASSTPPLAILELLDRLEAAEKERDALRAKVAEMEKQEPARLVTATAYRWRYRGAIKWQYGELTEETVMAAKEHNHEVQSLGVLPGAHPAQLGYVPASSVHSVIHWLRNGCDPMEAADELEMLTAAPEAKP